MLVKNPALTGALAVKKALGTANLTILKRPPIIKCGTVPPKRPPIIKCGTMPPKRPPIKLPFGLKLPSIKLPFGFKLPLPRPVVDDFCGTGPRPPLPRPLNTKLANFAKAV